MQDTGVKEVLVGRGSLIIGAVIAAAALLGMFYLFEHRYGITWPKVGWSLAFAALIFTTFYVKYRDKPVVRQIDKPGMLALKTSAFLFVVVFLLSIPNLTELFDTVMAEVWPLLLGAVLSWFAGSLYYVVFRH